MACAPGTLAPPLPVTTGQLRYEFEHLMAKVAVRDPAHALVLTGGAELPRIASDPAYVPEPHPLFTVVDGPMEAWERA